MFMSKDNRVFLYQHKKEYEIRFTDVDFQDRLKASSLLALMEESACLSAAELGFGYDDIAPKNLGFILMNWYVDLYRPIVLGEKLEIITWPIRPQRVQIFRDFELYVNGQKVGVASSRWLIVNVLNFTLMPAPAVFAEKDVPYNDFRSVEVSCWKLPQVSSQEVVYTKPVVYSDYDHYQHVNNTKYADMIMDVIGLDAMNNAYAQSIQIAYVKQCKLGETICFFVDNTDNEYVVEARVNDESRMRAKVILNAI